MGKYLLIESRSPSETKDVSYFYDLAQGLVENGNDVTLFLVQNAVLSARRSPRAESFAGLNKAGVRILADDFSLQERGIPAERLVTGIESAPLDTVVDQMAQGAKTLWH